MCAYKLKINRVFSIFFVDNYGTKNNKDADG